MGADPAAEHALAFLTEVSADMRGGAIFAADGRLLAASSDDERWGKAGAALLEAAGMDGPESPEQVHVATEEGEVFAVRVDGLTAVAVTERFALASLMAFDMRAALRDVAASDRVGDG